MSAAVTLVAFWGLALHVAASPARRARLRAKPAADWALEVVNLLVQGALIPMVLVVLLARGWAALLPGLRGALDLPPWAAFLLNFAGVDYLYYWNHRLLHTRALWPLHLVHHTAEAMDVFATSRNTVWTSFLILYVWVNALAAHILADPTWFLAGAAVTAVLDLWRHSALDAAEIPWLRRALGGVLVLPRDHAWHHASSAEPGNYGANLVLWDKLHGTYLGPREAPRRLGVECHMGFARRLLFPFEKHR